jgi:hypothetical protein
VAYARQCDRCKRIIQPRGDRTPRFCPFCGQRLTSGPMQSPCDPELTNPWPVALITLGAALLAAISILLAGAKLPFGALAIGLGFSAQRELRSGPAQGSAQWLAQAAIVIGMITSVIWLLHHIGR